MLYTICIILILIASIIIIGVVLVQNPKSGMAANFGASNQVIGVLPREGNLDYGDCHRCIEPVRYNGNG